MKVISGNLQNAKFIAVIKLNLSANFQRNSSCVSFLLLQKISAHCEIHRELQD
jgi:hypothetical protein